MVLGAILVAVLTVFFPALTRTEIHGRDWRYFDSLSWLTRSSVWHYHTLPLHDPWCGGGSSLLANPQTRLFSPAVLLDLIFAPYWANLWGLVIYAFFGLWGMFALLQELRIGRRASAVGAVLWVNGSWFGLHFAEGHTAFGSMQLLPWVLWAWLTVDRPLRAVLWSALFAFFLVDGNVYCFIYGLFLCLGVGVTGLFFPGVLRSPVFNAIRARPRWVLEIGFFALLASAPKWLPVYLEFGGRKPAIESFIIPLKTLLISFFWPAQRLVFPTQGTVFSFQEYGCYLGLFTLPGVIWALRGDRAFRRWAAPFGCLAVFWLWTASGWGTPVNVWPLFQKIPLLNNAHVQSRLLLLFFLFYVVIAARAIEVLLESGKRGARVWILVILVESVLVRNFPFADYLNEDSRQITAGMIHSHQLRSTVDFVDKPDIYALDGQATRQCYEPAALSSSVIRAVGDPDYRGEIEVDSGFAAIDVFEPGRIRFSLSDSPASTRVASKVVTLNTLDLGHWHVRESREDGGPIGAKITSSKGQRLQLEVEPGRSIVELKFMPYYFWPLVVAWFVGWGGLASLAWSARP